MLQLRLLYQAIGVVGATLCLTVSLLLLYPRLLLWDVLPDFTIFWTAGALVVGSLFASPHGMRYDLATLAPVFAMGLLSGTLRGLLVSVPLFALYSITILPALIVSLLAELSRRRRAVPSPAGPSR